jgi:hypothetical protein
MDKEIREYTKNNTYKWFTPTRKNVFNSKRVKDFRILKTDDIKKHIKIQFNESSVPALSLEYWMFDRVLDRLSQEPDYVMIGARLQPPYPKGSLEEAVWTKPYPRNSSYKVSSHICDILDLCGRVSYGYTINHVTGRRVQGVKLVILTK